MTTRFLVQSLEWNLIVLSIQKDCLNRIRLQVLLQLSWNVRACFGCAEPETHKQTNTRSSLNAFVDGALNAYLGIVLIAGRKVLFGERTANSRALSLPSGLNGTIRNPLCGDSILGLAYKQWAADARIWELVRTVIVIFTHYLGQNSRPRECRTVSQTMSSSTSSGSRSLRETT
jgi:hypothetical protein